MRVSYTCASFLQSLSDLCRHSSRETVTLLKRVSLTFGEFCFSVSWFCSQDNLPHRPGRTREKSPVLYVLSVVLLDWLSLTLQL